MTMRERLARVCCETLFGGFDASNAGEISPEGQSRKAIDAILDELMKPDDGMVEAASQGFDLSRGGRAFDWQRDAFTAAIKHAKEGM
jgi:hypothetical protein